MEKRVVRRVLQELAGTGSFLRPKLTLQQQRQPPAVPDMGNCVCDRGANAAQQLVGDSAVGRREPD